MAMIKCSECGKQMSDKAKTCPHCGNSMNKAITLSDIKMLAYKYKIYLIIAFIIIVAIIVFCCNFASLEGKYVYDFTSYGYKFPMSISLYKDNTCLYNNGAIDRKCTYKRIGNQVEIYIDGEHLKTFKSVGNNLENNDKIYEKVG